MERYSRQNLTLGEKATQNLFSSSVLLIGLDGGLATEILKNLLLSGVNSIYLLDSLSELKEIKNPSGFYFNNDDVRGRASLILSERMKHLNPTCKISVIESYDVLLESSEVKPLVILCNEDKEKAIKLNDDCRLNNCKMIWAYSKGVCGFVFDDVLENHVVKDLDGETVDPLQIENFGLSGTIEVLGDLNNVQDGNFIRFVNLVGNNIDFLRNDTFKVSVKNRNSLVLEDIDTNLRSNLEKMDLQNGTIIVTKSGETFSHASLTRNMNGLSAAGGEFLIENSFNPIFDRNLLEILFSWQSNADHCWSEEVDSFVSKIESKEHSLIARSLLIEIPAVSSIIGAYASSEAIKIITSKFAPLKQWFVYSDYSLVPGEKPTGSFDGSELAKLFGSDYIDLLSKTSLFLVGVGAIGCEMIKNLSQLNFSTDGVSKIIMTDPDVIANSNLSRQFLFRNEHVNKLKSEIAGLEILKHNPKIGIETLNQKMSPENQSLVNKIFESDIRFVVNALDNVEARRYIDDQCFNNSLALFESGTQGMKGNIQPVIPYLTETYGNTNDPDQEKSFPVCTIKNFPNQPHHTIHWALDFFEFFRRAPENVNNFIEDNKFFNNLSGYDKGTALKDLDLMLNIKDPTWQDCAKWAGKMYLENFRDNILQILSNFPEDSLNVDGTMFWSKGKRCPKSLDLDITNDKVLDFIESTTMLLLHCYYGENKPIFSRNDLIDVDYEIYEYHIKDIKIAKDDKELSEMKSEEISVDDLSSKFESLSIRRPESKFYPHMFEKDDDSNYHIMFIRAASNLRATNYGISTLSFEETKSIAGKIIPAVATTTSLVSGLSTIEIMKYCYHLLSSGLPLNSREEFPNLKIDSFKSYFVNMATNIFVGTDPIDAPKIKIGEIEINSWKKFEEKSDMKVKDFIKKYSEEFKDEISTIIYGACLLYADFMGNDSDLELNLSKLIIDKCKIDPRKESINLHVVGDNEDLPSIKFSLT